MPIQAQKIVDEAENFLPISIDNDDAVMIINESVNQMGVLGLAYGEVTIDYDKSEEAWTVIPNDAITVIHVVDEDGNPYYRWQYEDNLIRFAESGTYKVAARKLPESIEKLTDIIDLNSLYKSALVSYMRGFIKLRDDDHSPDGVRLIGEFRELAASTFNTLIRKRKPSQVRVVRHA